MAIQQVEKSASHPRRLFAPLAILLLCLLVVNVAIHQAARRSQRHQLLSRLESLSPKTQCLFLGNSLMEAGWDAAAFRTSWPESVCPTVANVALGATSPVEHCLILKHALERRLRPKFVVYGFFDDQLSSSCSGDYADLIGNRAINYAFPSEAADLLSPGSRLERWKLQTIAAVPMLAERSSLWEAVEKLRRMFEDTGMPHHRTNRFGRVDDFAALEASDAAEFTARCRKALSGSSLFSTPVEEILHLAREQGATLVLVEMPMPSRHRQRFYSTPAWQEMRKRLRSLAASEHAIYVPAGDWIPDDSCFEDATHLNERGAKLFSAKLAQEVSSLEVHEGHQTNPVTTLSSEGKISRILTPAEAGEATVTKAAAVNPAKSKYAAQAGNSGARAE